MEVYKKYIGRQGLIEVKNLEDYAPITVVIPCYNEPNIKATLQSLWENKGFDEVLHTIVVVNQNEESSRSVIKQNQKTIQVLNMWKQQHTSHNRILSIMNITFPSGKGGVGNARKLGMDKAIIEYAGHNKDGILVSLDADTICADNYLVSIKNCYDANPRTNATVIAYKHQVDNYPENQRNAIAQYELFLRYMRLAYKYTGHPNYYHTIGSAFTVKASAYCKQGGMNSKQAGEDFYFLQKIFKLGHILEINTTFVYPSGRCSDRVPFGTGRAIADFMENNTLELKTYNFSAFSELKGFFSIHRELYKISLDNYNILIYSSNIGGLVKSWLIEDNFWKCISEINSNCSSAEMFSKKFFENFSILNILKYLNFCHKHFIRKEGIIAAIKSIPNNENIDFSTVYSTLDSLREQ